MKNKHLILVVSLFSAINASTLISMEQETMHQGKRQSTGSTHHSSDGEDRKVASEFDEKLTLTDIKKESLIPSFNTLKIEEISNNHLIAQYPDEALDYFEQRLVNKDQFKGFLANISYDLGEIGHDYRYNKDFEKAAKAYLLSFYYDDKEENLDLRALLNDIGILNDLVQDVDFNKQTQQLAQVLSKISY